jgi:hypothetical protein
VAANRSAAGAITIQNTVTAGDHCAGAGRRNIRTAERWAVLSGGASGSKSVADFVVHRQPGFPKRTGTPRTACGPVVPRRPTVRCPGEHGRRTRPLVAGVAGRAELRPQRGPVAGQPVARYRAVSR